MSEFKNVIVLAAMPEEEASLIKELGAGFVGQRTFGKRLRIAANDFRVGDVEVTVAQSGMGTVNAALTLHSIVENRHDRAPVDAVLLLGVGGSIVPGLEIGELVLSTAVYQHDYLSSLDFGDARMLPGDIIFTAEQACGYDSLTAADGRLVDMVASSVREIPVRKGVVVSGNEFVGTLARKRHLNSLCPGSLLADMEAAGVAQFCRKLEIPFVVAKTVADRLEPDGTIESDFRACLEFAARNAAIVLKDFLEADR